MGGSGLGASTTLVAAALDNTGVFDVTATGETSADSASVLLASAAGFGTAGMVTGQVNLDGNAVVAFAGGGEIGTIAGGAQLYLQNGAGIIDAGGTANSALAALAVNAGELDVASDDLSLSGDLDNTGRIDLDDQYFGVGGSTLTLAGTLTNSGNLDMGGSGIGASATLSAGGLANSSDITLTGASPTALAVLRVAGAVSNDGAIVLDSYAVAELIGGVSGTGSIGIAANAALTVGTLGEAPSPSPASAARSRSMRRPRSPARSPASPSATPWNWPGSTRSVPRPAPMC